MKTNAIRLLDEVGIQYELREYEVDPEDLTAETVAAKISVTSPIDHALCRIYRRHYPWRVEVLSSETVR